MTIAIWAVIAAALLWGLDPGVDRADPRDADLTPLAEIPPEQRERLRALARDTQALDSLLTRLDSILGTARY